MRTRLEQTPEFVPAGISGDLVLMVGDGRKESSIRKWLSVMPFSSLRVRGTTLLPVVVLDLSVLYVLYILSKYSLLTIK